MGRAGQILPQLLRESDAVFLIPPACILDRFGQFEKSWKFSTTWPWGRANSKNKEKKRPGACWLCRVPAHPHHHHSEAFPRQYFASFLRNSPAAVISRLPRPAPEQFFPQEPSQPEATDSFFPSAPKPASTSSPLCILRTHQQIASTLHHSFRNCAVQGLTNLNV